MVVAQLCSQLKDFVADVETELEEFGFVCLWERFGIDYFGNPNRGVGVKRYITTPNYILCIQCALGLESTRLSESPNVEEAMEIEPPEEYDDVNEEVVKEWIEETTTRERIRSVIQRTYEPTPASIVAERARASEPVVRDTLADLVDMGLVQSQETGQGRLYKRNDQMYIYQQVVDIQNQYTEGELVAQLQSLKETVNSFRAEYGVESPTELAQELDPTDTDGWEDHTTWQTTQKNLYLVKAALSFYDAQRVVV